MEPKYLKFTITNLQFSMAFCRTNSANNWVAFNYTLPYDKTEVTVKIVDTKGKLVTSFLVTGTYGQKVWDTRKLNSGVYLYTLSVGEFTRSGKIVISK